MSATLRYKHLKKSGKYSVYIDTYYTGERHYEFLKIYVSKDYSNIDTSKIKNIKRQDRDGLAKAISICGMRNEEYWSLD